MLNENTVWTLAATGAGLLGAVAARRILQTTWKAFTHTDPPENPADPSVTWGRAILWTALTGAVIGVARMVALRAATNGFERVARHAPPTYHH
jgi:hypothetical protein